MDNKVDMTKKVLHSEIGKQVFLLMDNLHCTRAVHCTNLSRKDQETI